MGFCGESLGMKLPEWSASAAQTPELPIVREYREFRLIHYRAVEHEDTAEFVSIEDVHLLKIALSAVDDLSYLEGETGVLL